MRDWTTPMEKTGGRVSTLLCGVFLIPMALGAVDGVIEINDARAQIGISATDPFGYPVTLDTPGSYRLTGNLSNPSAATPAIEITADGVTLDLNGFTVAGPASCSGTGSGVTCSGTGNGAGISITGDHVTVRNGVVTGAGREGIKAAGDWARIENIRAVGNGFDGIAISPGLGGVVTGSSAIGNGFAGIYMANAGRIEGNESSDNNVNGIETDGETLVRGNLVRGNGGDGVKAAAGALVLENTLIFNELFGLDGLVTVGYARNLIADNVGGTVDSGTQTGTNICNDNTVCP